MTVATQLTAQTRVSYISQGPAPIEVARLLIEKGADVNAASKDGVTAIMVAAGHNNAPIVGLLAGSGADLGLKSAAGLTALEIAEAARNESAIGALKLVARPTAGQGATPASGAEHN
jgi:ankyrin repeat protein